MATANKCEDLRQDAGHDMFAWFKRNRSCRTLLVAKTDRLPIVGALREDQKHAESKLRAQRTRLDSRLALIRKRMDAAYADKLDGKIPRICWNAR